MKIRKGDTVLIISGKDRGKQGKIIQVLRKNNQVLVEGVNLRKKHQKPKKQGQKGQIILKPGSISISNVKIICRKCGKPVKVGYKIEEKKKYRICKKCREEI
ncbi:MAG: 50S ribosomal protein L24 [Candidatus Nealsonbacteria bacterium]|nr:50S ribosomal protein L24 [Candidatus Nealsonbacteria bacterium]